MRLSKIAADTAAGAGARRRAGPRASLLCLALALSCVGVCAALLWHYPLSGPLPGVLLVLVVALAAAWPALWLVALPALLPLVALAPWTGWIAVEEFDMLVLAFAAGAYARRAFGSPSALSGRPADAAPLLGGLLILVYAAGLCSATVRGVADAGGADFGWFQGYREPANSLRLAKGFVWALLLWPLWRSAHAASPGQTAALWRLGMTLGLIGASLAAVWERAAFTGLLDFSADYRTTALFWEMHVGGAALDAFLALALPFAVCQVLCDRGPRRWLALMALLLAGYTSLTTFSRVLYLALPAAVALSCALHALQRTRKDPRAAPQFRGLLGPMLLLAGFGAAAAWMFPSSGYRGLLGLFGAMLILLPLVVLLARATRRQWAQGLGGGVLLSGLALLVADTVTKGAYWAYAACLAIAGLVFFAQRAAVLAPAALAGFIGVLAGLLLVSRHWGGAPAMNDTVPVVAVLLAVAGSSHRLAVASWPRGPARQVWLWAGMALAAATVGVFSGGAYMGGRFASTGDDFAGRLAHWRHSVGMLRSPSDWLLGAGLGRFPDRYAVAAPDGATPGDYRLRSDGASSHLVQTAGDQAQGWGQMLRMSQRIAAVSPGPLTVTLDVRTERVVKLYFEVCEKHLIYSQNCVSAVSVTEALPGRWQHLSVPLAGEPPSGGAWYAPRFITFSMAVDSEGQRAELDHVALTAPGGRTLLQNGDFSAGLAHWLFSSDRNHFPWHAKNMVLQTLFEQGLLGVVLLAALVAGALWRLTVGGARDHALAPALGGALLGFVLVGLVDDPLEVPRLAFLFSMLALIGLTLAPARAAHARVPSAPAAGPPPRRGQMHRVMSSAFLASAWVAVGGARAEAAAPPPPVMQVGPGRSIQTLAEAARQAVDGSRIEVDAGEYRRDVAVWPQSNLSLQAVGGRVRLIADGAAAEGKAIWVLRGRNVTLTGFDFEGARVPDLNGAGIRLESGTLRVVDCSFAGNQSGILTSNDGAVELSVENSEFARQIRADGRNHHVYAGTIRSLSVSGSYFHHAEGGHLIKSRAALTRIEYNLLADGADGHASYELELPSGGVGVVIGNVIQQSRLSENPHMLSYATEDYRWSDNRLYVAHNTFVNDMGRAAAGFIRVRPGATAVRVLNNLFVGAASIETGSAAEVRSNFVIGAAELQDAGRGDYRLRPDSPAWERAIDADAAGGASPSLTPTRQYEHPRRTRALVTLPRLPGALQADSARR